MKNKNTKQLLNLLVADCKKCSSKRQELAFDELSIEMKNFAKSTGEKKLKFLHCEKCNETSFSWPMMLF